MTGLSDQKVLMLGPPVEIPIGEQISSFLRKIPDPCEREMAKWKVQRNAVYQMALGDC